MLWGVALLREQRLHHLSREVIIDVYVIGETES
jgi:hypothetical protein